MRSVRPSAALAPAAGVVSALTTLACCLPWGIGAALGTLGLSVFFARFRTTFVVLSIVLLGVGLFQLLRAGRRCGRRSWFGIVSMSIAAVAVLAIILFPEWVASLISGHLP